MPTEEKCPSEEKFGRGSFRYAQGRSRRDFVKLGLATSAAAVFASRRGTSFAETAQRTGRVLTRASPGDLAFLTLSEASKLVRTKRISPVELTNACLARIEALQPVLNAFITVTAEAALDQAREAEAEIQQGRWRGPLHGIPIGLKDEFDTAGVRTTAASRLFLERIPDEDAEVVHRLKEAGAIFLGKQNMDELGGVGRAYTGYFGEVHNPWDLSRYAGGGSSTGPAAALAAGLSYGALGADTGASIRGPASWCGIVGLKPTYGRVSNRGVIPYSWSLDHAGPMTRTVVDSALMLQVIAGYDERDTTTVDVPVPDYVASLEKDTKSLRLGVPRVPYFEDLNPEVDAAVSQAVSVLNLLTAGVQEIDLQPLDLAFPSTEFIASVNAPLAGSEAWTFHEPYVGESPELYWPQVLEKLRRWAQIPASEYIRARRDLDVARRAIAGIFSEVDLLVTPTVRDPAHQIGEMPGGMLARNLNRFNIYGLPAISVPCGFTRSGLPIGLQIVGPRWDEGTVLRLAHAYERATDWHNRHPDL